LLGENGAGKSTLLNIMSGSLKMDSGNIYIHGEPAELNNPVVAKRRGIVKVHQELQIIPELTVAENIFLGDEILRPGLKTVWYKKMQEESDKLLERLGAEFKSTTVAKN
jgi:ABC-type sugar transport system ATPase subunit